MNLSSLNRFSLLNLKVVRAIQNSLVILLFSCCLVAEVRGEEHLKAINSSDEARVCVSYNGENHPSPWGYPEHNDCTKGHAAISVVRAVSNEFDQRHKNVNCCEMRYSDILLDDHIIINEICPQDYVVTSDTYLKPDCLGCPLDVRCTRINTDRYQLGPATEGAYWGLGSNTWKMRHAFLRRDLPMSIRYALGRVSEFNWTNQGCFGYPFGSLLTSVEGRECHQFTFRQLQYRGMKGDPKQGTPVKLFADCRRISSEFDRDPKCIN